MSYPCSLLVGLSLLLAGCGDRKVGSETCADMGVWRQLSPELSSECKGNTGCRVQPPQQCGCHCAVCENEQCISSICDDSCMPTCPATRPVPGSSCTVSLSDCDYTIERCPCGPSDLKWRCSCVANAWSCAREYDCYPCMDGRRDAGVDARSDGPSMDAVKKDHAVTKDALKLDAGKCQVPSYPADCSQVSHFDCGFSAMCTGNVVKAMWHEHVFCGDGMEQIYSYSCSYTCPGSCLAASAWPQNGTDLVQAYCK